MTTVLELWTAVRFFLYPIMFVFGFGWGLFMAQQYRCTRHAALAWSAWLGWSVMALGAAGFLALFVAHQSGFTPFTSGILTVGMIFLTTVCVIGTVALWHKTWKDRTRNNAP